ncbi:TOTE conflict system archaeo-eukaryotic primase domain-containing protein [Streptomyces luteolus]|uniref:DEAD/DEAH box helicase family protein n=1 Tax=Streptomyces luteolus TaxID=3043615 RepID=A0ABT6SVD6_9ACTN|nr:DEAD/DEAH box helicase family protein [Streptomyces sp. B-S-A12]MDI3418809.1 DEAD/DEAH box helicase family protein [Streptomyces sp. B-S-A12]
MDVWEDPAELRIRLDVAVEENAALREENRRLRDLQLGPAAQAVPCWDEPSPPQQVPSAVQDPAVVPVPPSGLLWADARSTVEAKLALFKALFAGRSDVYARRWAAKSGKTGWSPAETKRPWERRPGEERELLPLTDRVLIEHLSRPEPGSEALHVGLYPLLTDDTCWLLVCDFDDRDWRGDAAAYHQACRVAGVPAYAEISRSGEGAHVWTFFTDPVPAGLARQLGAALLRDAMTTRERMSLASFDRFFPAQDLLPTKTSGNGSFGNLIALPLNGACRERGTTLFCDPATWTPYPDQFAHLSQIQRLSRGEFEALVNTLQPVEVGPAATLEAMPPKPRRTTLGKALEVVRARLGAMLAIATQGLPAPLVAALKHLASLHNPDVYKKQKMRYSTFGTSRFVMCFDTTDTDWLRIPRGLADQAAKLIASAGGDLRIDHDLPKREAITARFTGELTPVQAKAVDTMAEHITGVLVAPPGTGKTVMACALIAKAAQPAAILVNKAELLSQWRERLATFLDLGESQVGSLGGGKDRRNGVVDLVMLQSLAHRDAPDQLLDGYGLVIVDECHAIGAPAAVAAVNKAAVRRWTGLSATPYRADQMDALITMQCGPIRHEIADQTTFTKHLIVHPTAFTTEETGDDGVSFQALYGELAANEERNAQIAADIANAARRGRHSLALSNRIEHLHRLTEALHQHGIRPMLLHGRLSAAERAEVRAALDSEDASPTVLLAIDKVAGEGFDAARLDCLFLTSPFRFKGKSIQQVGRVIRELETGKTDVEVHDYVDVEVSRLESMHHHRRRVLARRGFTTRTSTEPSVAQGSTPQDSPVPIQKPHPGKPTVAEVRAWARDNGHAVPDRGRLRADIWTAWHAAHPT